MGLLVDRLQSDWDDEERVSDQEADVWIKSSLGSNLLKSMREESECTGALWTCSRHMTGLTMKLVVPNIR